AGWRTGVLGTGGSELSVQVADHNGTPYINVGLAGGSAVKFAKKDPFGVDRSPSPSWRSHKGFVGGDDDSSTGLVHLGAREYEPATGRFISADPLIDIGDPVQINGYSYSENNPVTFADPTGLMSAAQGGGGGGGGYNGDEYGGPSKSELSWAQAEQNRSMSSVIADAGWSLLKGLIGYDDMIACFSRGDLWACGRMIIDALPWTKVFSAAKKVWQAVSRISGAISAWKKAQEKARQIIEMARKAQEAARKAAEAKKKAAEKAAQLKKKAEQAKLRAAKQAAQKTGNAVQKAKKAAAKKAEKPINRARQQVKKEDSPGKSGRSGSRSGSSRGEGSSSGGAGPGCKSDSNSFVPGTLVLMADGTTKPIEEVRNGDRVVATDPETGETAVETVVGEIRGEGSKNLVEITIDTDGAKGSATSTVTATDGHPFWVPELKEWIDATDLAAGNWLRTGAGTLAQITAVERHTAQATVHNFTVSDLHTYYVLAGAVPVLAHNCPTGGFISKIISRSKPERPEPNATVADLRSIRIEDVGGTDQSRGQMKKLKKLDEDKLMTSVFTPKSGPGDVLTVGTAEKRMSNGNHRAYLLMEAARHHANTGEGKIAWDTPIYIRNWENWSS
ncbi:polymorphic toxin-type HINT domain-containing protein, partial [Streptomyces sp. NPDC003691]